MKNAEYLYKVWIKDIGMYRTRSQSSSPFFKTMAGAQRVADRWGNCEVHKFKITKVEDEAVQE